MIRSSQKNFIETHQHRQAPTAQRFFILYLKPLVLAATATLLLSFLLAYSCLLFASGFSTSRTKPGSQSKPLTILHTSIPVEQAAAWANKIVIKPAQQEANTVFTLPLSSTTIYQLQRRTTYQQVATLDSNLLPQLTRELDAQGIEYEVHKNSGSVPLIAPNEWTISWGGTIYIPEGTAIHSL